MRFNGSRFGAIAVMTVAVVGAALLQSVGLAPIAVADTAPVSATTTKTVSADALPTVQVNGVVWNQVVVGSTVYATGAFTSARPAGSAAGTNETARGNLLAYNLTTGALVTSWAPTINAQGLTIAASPDGSRIYVGGDFTTANGTARNRIAAFDATTGALVTSFAPGVNGRVRALVVTPSTVYAGGAFTSTGGSARGRLAAFATSNGALQAWAPVADQEVMALLVPGANNELVVGGHFTTLGGAANKGMGAVDLTTGALLAWPVNQTIQNWGPDAAIWSLSSDGAQVYGTGYGYLVNGTANTNANLENSFAATLTGDLVWANGCYGDTYGSYPQNGVLYTVGHPHNCSAIGGHPQTDPWTYQRALATTTTRGANNAVNLSGTLAGQPAPDLLHWLPTLTAGSYTGQYQAAWTVTGNSQYVVLGGEFPSVNGTAQQGLVRFATSAIAPNKQGPVLDTSVTPTAVSLAAGRVRVAWTAAWDRDNRNLKYELLRGSTVLTTVTQDSAWWSRPRMFFNDTTATPGTSQTYRVRVTDAFGNTATSGATTFAVPAGTSASPYATAVLGDGATHLWRLGEASGTTAYDWAAADDLTLDPSATRGADGALANETAAKATTFSGAATVPAVTPTAVTGPQSFGVEAWFRTTSTSGGKIVGFGSSNTGDSSSYDRQVYLTNSGNVVFGVYPNQVKAVTSPLTYNDGQWHQVVANLGSTGMELWVDGRRVGRDTSATSAQDYSGYWRIGGDNLGGWPNQPASNKLAGSLEDVAVYGAPLPQAQVQNHFQAGGRSLNLPARPTDAYGAAVWDANPSFYWRLDETAGTGVTDRMTNTPSGLYSTGVRLGQPGISGTAVTLPGDSAQTVVASTAVDNPTTYSLETWFRTTTTRGGRLIGFGNAQSGSSGNYDRYIYMLNDGTLRYGIWTGSAELAASTSAYNDGVWHQAVATQGPGGMTLYVDGQLVGTNPATTPQGYTGYWRLGSDNTWGGADSNDFAGSLDEAAVYDSVLPAATVSQHWTLGRPVTANVKPTAAFTSSVGNLASTFDASGSADTDGTIAAYVWDFGDGTTGTGSAAAHTYAAAGTWTVKLTVTDNDGASDSVTHTVTTTPAPNQKPTAAFAASATALAASFDGSASADPDGTIAAYAWDFGDSSTGTGVRPAHTYAAAGTYTVKLTVTDDRGATDSVSQAVTVAKANQPPVAVVTPTCTNLACTFSSAGSGDPDGTIAGYAWTFGDGTSATTANPAHTFAAAGTYTVALTVTDDKGATGTASSAVTVTVPANQLPTAAFTSSASNLAASFDGSGSSDRDGTVSSYAWDFGDSSTGTGVKPAHTYASAGTYPVKLTVTDDRGGAGSITQSVTVTKANQAPTAAFTPACTNLACTFTSTSTDADGTVVATAWDFGDGSTSTAANPAHAYAAAGTYSVVLTVTDDKGATGTASAAVTVTAAPSTLAADTFTRSVANGFGSAETGGVWTLSGAATNFAVAGGQGTMKMPTAGLGVGATLNGVSASGTDLTVTAAVDRVGTGNGTYVWVTGRRTAAGEYRGRVRFLATGGLAVQLSRYVNGTETVVGTETTVSGLTYAAGTPIRIRLQADGTGTTTLRLKVWRADSTEPSAWAKTGTDTTAGFQVAGSVGLATYLSGSSTNAPVTVSFDDLTVGRP